MSDSTTPPDGVPTEAAPRPIAPSASVPVAASVPSPAGQIPAPRTPAARIPGVPDDTEAVPGACGIRPETPFRIELAGPEDHDAIRRLFRQSMLEGQLRDNDTGADIEDLQAGYFNDDGGSAFFVARMPGEDGREQVVGMIGVQQTRESTAEIRRLRVRQDCRRRGIGTALMERALDFCRDRGHLKVVLDVRVEQGPAQALFEKFGFTHARTREIDNRRTLDFYLDLYRDARS